jgi:hypothetical protein
MIFIIRRNNFAHATSHIVDQYILTPYYEILSSFSLHTYLYAFGGVFMPNDVLLAGQDTKIERTVDSVVYSKASTSNTTQSLSLANQDQELSRKDRNRIPPTTEDTVHPKPVITLFLVQPASPLWKSSKLSITQSWLKQSALSPAFSPSQVLSTMQSAASPTSNKANISTATTESSV